MTLTPDDRARCAAALRPVSPETLMQWAEWANANAGFEERHGDLAAVDRWAGLAALALAVAKWTAQPTCLTSYEESWDDDALDMSWALRNPMTMDYEQHPTLPAALAALLERDA